MDKKHSDFNAALVEKFEKELVAEAVKVHEEALADGVARYFKLTVDQLPKTVGEARVLLDGHSVTSHHSDPLGQPIKPPADGDHSDMPLPSVAYRIDGTLIAIVHPPTVEYGRIMLRFSTPTALMTQEELDARPTSTEHANAVIEREAGKPNL
jgi:7-keto-8-aminopelargonate synthetase-like enzyme